MAQYVLWDDERDVLLSVVRNLPAALRGRSSTQLQQLGYRERVVRHPEDYIPRFPELLGSSDFEKMPDGRVLETFPEADFSVAAIRDRLKHAVREDAARTLSGSDWYVIRKAELGTDVPEDVVRLRQMIRGHIDWLDADIDAQGARELVEYQWKFPNASNQVMVNGLPVVFTDTPPEVLPPLPAPPAPDDAVTGEDQGVFGNDDPHAVDEAPLPLVAPELLDPPDTTDGPVPMFIKGEEPPFDDPNGVPLVTVYAPNVPADQVGPRPDQDQDQEQK